MVLAPYQLRVEGWDTAGLATGAIPTMKCTLRLPSTSLRLPPELLLRPGPAVLANAIRIAETRTELPSATIHAHDAHAYADLSRRSLHAPVLE